MDQRQRIEAVRKRLREMQIDERQAELAGPPCVECVHVSDTCGHLAYTERVFDPVSGKFKEMAKVSPAIARQPDGLCGPEGLLFEAPPTPHLVLRTAKVAALTVGGLGMSIGVGAMLLEVIQAI